MRKIVLSSLPVLILLLIMLFSAVVNATKCNCVAFRLDDVADFFLDDVQITIMDHFLKRDANLTVGIIGNYFGNDSRLVSFLHTQLSRNNNQSIIEIADHGWKHEDFRAFDKAQQSLLLNKSQKKLKDTLGINTTIFIAPGNVINNDTIKALQESHFRYVSSRLNYTSGPVDLKRANLYFLPQTVSFDYLNPNTGLYDTWSTDILIQTIRSSISKYGMAVVTLHPMGFALENQTHYLNQIDANEIEKLDSLIELLKNKKIPIFTISDVADHLQGDVNYLKNRYSH